MASGCYSGDFDGVAQLAARNVLCRAHGSAALRGINPATATCPLRTVTLPVAHVSRWLIWRTAAPTAWIGATADAYRIGSADGAVHKMLLQAYQGQIASNNAARCAPPAVSWVFLIEVIRVE